MSYLNLLFQTGIEAIQREDSEDVVVDMINFVTDQGDSPGNILLIGAAEEEITITLKQNGRAELITVGQYLIYNNGYYSVLSEDDFIASHQEE